MSWIDIHDPDCIEDLTEISKSLLGLSEDIQKFIEGMRSPRGPEDKHYFFNGYERAILKKLEFSVRIDTKDTKYTHCVIRVAEGRAPFNETFIKEET